MIRKSARARQAGAADPFAVLGVERRADLSDDDVRAAWRRLATATHPDRADGGDPARFAAAAAAYTSLRTVFGRGEALADFGPGPAGTGRTGRPFPVKRWSSWTGIVTGAPLADRVRRGRPGRLALRVLAAAGAGAVAVTAGGWHPAALALITGAATWLACTARRDLAPPR